MRLERASRKVKAEGLLPTSCMPLVYDEPNAGFCCQIEAIMPQLPAIKVGPNRKRSKSTIHWIITRSWHPNRSRCRKDRLCSMPLLEKVALDWSCLVYLFATRWERSCLLRSFFISRIYFTFIINKVWYAVKEINKYELMQHKTGLQMIMGELEALRKISHPFIVGLQSAYHDA